MIQFDSPHSQKESVDERQLFLPHFGIIKNAYRGRDGILRDVFFQPSNRLREIEDAIHSDPEYIRACEESNRRRNEDWNRLHDQVVGAEVFK